MSNSKFIALNEDCSHYFFTRADQELTPEIVESWVDQYAGTQVERLLLNPNAMRTSYASDVWDPVWKGYDPELGDDQPHFAGLKDNPEEITPMRIWTDTALRLHMSGIDVYRLWIDGCRKVGISPWVTMRMNDVHSVENDQHPIHSTFWRENPQLRRIAYKLTSGYDRAFDYSYKEVRDYHMLLVKELVERYDFDGFELDWMRFSFHFAPGSEGEGIGILNEFMSDVRKLMDEWEVKRGHKISIGVRVPSTPEKARAMGMDAIEWAKRGLIDTMNITPFFSTIDTDMPIEIWKQLLDGTGVTLGAGFEILLSPYPAYNSSNPESIFKTRHTNSLETARGYAASALDRGADIIYLFNYMDSQTAMDDLHNYPTLLRELATPETLANKTRRHVITYTDTWATGETPAFPLPSTCEANGWNEFRLHTGPKPTTGNAALILGAESGTITSETIKVYINGHIVTLEGHTEMPMPRPGFPLHKFNVPLSFMKRGYNMIVLTSTEKITIGWVEIVVEA